MQRYVTRFYIKDMIYALVIVGMYFAWHRDVLQCRLEQDQYRIALQNKYDALVDKNREIERDNAQVRARADFYSAAHANHIGDIHTGIYELKQLFWKGHDDGRSLERENERLKADIADKRREITTLKGELYELLKGTATK